MGEESKLDAFCRDRKHYRTFAHGLPLTTHTSKEQLLRCSLSIIRFYFCCAASCFFNAAISAARSLIWESLPAICESIYHLDNSYSELQPEERLKMRQLTDPFRYMEYLLTELMKHLDDTDRSFLDDLLPWSKTLPDICRSNQQK